MSLGFTPETILKALGNFSLLLLSLTAIGCSTVSAPNHVFSAQELNLLSIKEGDTKEQVIAKLGPPHSQRYGQLGESMSTEMFWLYGTDDPKGFAKIGVVVFKTDGVVVRAYSPKSPAYFFRKEIDRHPLRKTSRANDMGLQCIIREVAIVPYEELREPNPKGRYEIKFEVKNTSNAIQKADLIDTILWTLTAVEIYDSRMQLVYRADLGRYAKPGPTDEPALTVDLQPLGSISDRILLFTNDVYFGPLPDGDYYVRMFFPIGKELISSGLYRWRVKGMHNLDPSWPSPKPMENQIAPRSPFASGVR